LNDILRALTIKYEFAYPEVGLLSLGKEVKVVIDDKAKDIDWNQQDDLKAELKADLVLLLAEKDYPPVDRDEISKEIFEQVEDFNKYRVTTRGGR